MIACPACGCDSSVVETRGQRRRRACDSVTCNQKFSTVELVVTDRQHGEHVAIKRDVVDKLRAILEVTL